MPPKRLHRSWLNTAPGKGPDLMPIPSWFAIILTRDWLEYLIKPISTWLPVSSLRVIDPSERYLRESRSSLSPLLSVFPTSLLLHPFIFFFSFFPLLPSSFPPFFHSLFSLLSASLLFLPLPYFPVSIPYSLLSCWLCKRKQAARKLYKYQSPSYPHKEKQSYLKLTLKVTELRDGENLGLWCHPWDFA